MNPIYLNELREYGKYGLHMCMTWQIAHGTGTADTRTHE